MRVAADSRRSDTPSLSGCEKYSVRHQRVQPAPIAPSLTQFQRIVKYRASATGRPCFIGYSQEKTGIRSAETWQPPEKKRQRKLRVERHLNKQLLIGTSEKPRLKNYQLLYLFSQSARLAFSSSLRRLSSHSFSEIGDGRIIITGHLTQRYQRGLSNQVHVARATLTH